MFLKTLLAAAALPLALAAAIPAAAQTVTPADAAMPEGATPGPALWRVADEDTVIYLFGTVHVLPDSVRWLDGRIEQAFASADELVTEIDVGDTGAMQQVVSERAALAGERTLRELMTPENRAQYEAALQAFGMPVETFDRMDPWMAAMTLSVMPLVSQGYNPQSGVEMSLSGRGSDKQKAALETVDEQIGMFDTLPMDVQLAYLDETVEQIPDTARSVGEMVDRWLAGDAVGLATLLNEEMDDPVLYQRLLTDRNARWAEWIGERLEQPGTVFVAVGAGHLAGRGSVQQQLAERGLMVDRIWQ